MKLKKYLLINWKKMLFLIFICLSFFLTDKLIVKADIISSDTVTTYFITNSSGSSIAELFTTGTETFTMPSNSRISRWIVSFNKNSFNLIPNQKYTFYLYFYINNQDYGWVENVANVKFTVDDITGTNYVSSTTGAYNSSTNYIVIEFDIIAPDLSNSSVAYITLDNTSSNKYALAYSTGSSSVVVGFSKLSYFLAEGSSGDQTIIDQNETIIDQNNKTNQELSDINDNLTNSDSTDATEEAGNFFSGFETDTFGLTSIITAPLDLIGSITSSSCSPLSLTIPFVNKPFNLPCMTTIYEDYFGDFLTIYQTITFGIVAYWVCVRIFALVKDFKNPDHDEIEVLDL